MCAMPAARRGSVPVSRHVRRIPPSCFSIAFGLAGLAGAWHAAAPLLGTPRQIADALYALAAAVWLALILAYLAQGLRQVRADLRDSVVSPLVSLAVITPMLLATGLAPASLAAARALVIIFLILAIILGGWLTGQWIVGRIDQDAMHPGYFLPTVAGGLVGAYAAALVQLPGVAQASFGIGVVSWVLLNSVVLNRLFFRAMLPDALVPMLAVEVAPPVLAGFAYFEMTGGRLDFLARALGGYAVLMVIVQLRFIPLYVRLRFTPASWAFTFAYATVATDAVLWLSIARPPGAQAYVIAVLALITILVACVAARTIVAIGRREFFPGPQRAGPTSSQ
jgi:tellurite resistance protein